MEQNDVASKTGCNIDSDLCFTCAVCNFMTNSREHLLKHTTAMHHGMPPTPIISTKITSESDYTSTKQADSLSMLRHGDGTLGVNLSTRERSDIPLYSDSSLKLEYIDDGTEDDSNLKHNVKDLSNVLSNINDSFNEFSSSCVKTEVGHNDKMFSDINQSTIKQEHILPSMSNFEVKDEIMHCQSCSYSDVDLDKLKSHKFTHHPTEAAIITKYVGETGRSIHEIRFFCIKETCFFSTTLCDVYEQHLLRCCSMHQTMTRIETERLKSTVTFVLDFHNKLGLDTASGFPDFVSFFNEICTSTADQDKIGKDVEVEFGISSSGLSLSNSTLLSDIKSCRGCDDENRNSECSFSSIPGTVLSVNTHNTDLRSEFSHSETTCVAKQEKHNEQLIKTDPYVVNFPSSSKGEIVNIESRVDQFVSNNVELENDTAGRPLYDNNAFFSEEMRKDNIKEEVNVSSKCNECGEIFSHKSNHLMYLGKHDKEKGFKCDKCTTDFGGNKIPLTHMRKYKKERIFKCNECGKGFSRNGNLKVHMRIHSVEKPFKCNECGKDFSQKSNLKVHMRLHSVEKPYKCSECGKDFSQKDKFTLHMKIHRGEKPFKCNECGKGFCRASYLSVHMNVHRGEKPNKCSECGKCFGRKYKLTVHMRIHRGEKPYKCNECGKSFSQKSNLKVHKAVHRAEKPFKCNECGKCFSQKSNLKVHMAVHRAEKPFKCNECGKCFSQKSNLQVHMTVHRGEKPFKCNDCGKGFIRMSNLSVHMSAHRGEKPYKCSECGKGFCRPSYLSVHMNVHKGEKPYKCSECGKCFGRKCKLTEHMRIHRGEKPYKCNECGKSFTQEGNLKVHMNVHRGKKPYIYNECGKCFSHKSSLKTHMIFHTREKHFKCNECGKGFSDKSTFTDHMRIHTEEKAIPV